MAGGPAGYDRFNIDFGSDSEVRFFAVEAANVGMVAYQIGHQDAVNRNGNATWVFLRDHLDPATFCIEQYLPNGNYTDNQLATLKRVILGALVNRSIDGVAATEAVVNRRYDQLLREI